MVEGPSWFGVTLFSFKGFLSLIKKKEFQSLSGHLAENHKILCPPTQAQKSMGDATQLLPTGQK